MTTMKMLVAVGLMLGAPAFAQESSAGASNAGKQMVQESFKKRDAELAPLSEKRSALQKQFNVLMTAEGYDEEKLAATMAEMRLVEGEIVEKTGASLLSLLKALSPEDRSLFLKALKQPAPAPTSRGKATGEAGR